MGQIISINNQKGGVAKTTTTQALGQGLSLEGFKVLLIDLDPQGNLSFSLGANTEGNTMYEVLRGQAKAEETIQSLEGEDLIPSSILLSGADLEFTQTGREYLLKDSLKPLINIYDFIIIDTPPTLGILTINSLTAADKTIIPIGSDIYSLQGLGQLNDTIQRVRKYVNPGLSIQGILMTRFNPRTILSNELKETAEDLAIKLNTKLYNTTIRESVAIREAQAQQVNIFKYAPNNNAILDYGSFLKEFLESELVEDEQQE